jgi:hypothetical protein
MKLFTLQQDLRTLSLLNFMDDDEPPPGREGCFRLPEEGERVRSVGEFNTYMGVLRAGFLGIVSKEVKYGENGGGHYWLEFDVRNVKFNRPMPYGGIVKRFVSKKDFVKEFEVVD